MRHSSYISRSKFILLFLITVLIMTACNNQKTEPKNAPRQEIILGVITYAQDDIEGYSTTNAVQMAVDEINTAGGVKVGDQSYQLVLKIETIPARSPELATAAAQKLINQENVVAIIGPQRSGDAIPAGGVAESAQIPLISGVSSNPSTTLDRQYVFRMGFVDDFQGVVIAHLALENLTAQTAAVLYDVSDAYSRGISEVFKAEFEANGGQVVAFETYTTDNPEFTAQLEAIHTANPDVLVLPNSSEYVEEQAIQARALGITATLLGGDGWERAKFRTIPEFEGAFMTTNWTKDSESAKSQAFVEAYKARFNLEPGDTAALTYDAVYLVKEAIQLQGAATPQAIREGLYKLDNYEGVGGFVDFVESGNPVRSGAILQFKDGQDIFYTSVNP